MQKSTNSSLVLTTLKDNVMKSTGCYDVLWDVMFNFSLQDALKANRDIPDFVVPGNVTTGSTFLQTVCLL